MPVTDWPQSPAGLSSAGLRLDRAGQRWPQAPAGLGLGRRWLGFAPAYSPRPCGSLMASSAGRAECAPGSVPTVPVTDWPQSPAGLWGSRFLRHVGGVGPRRGTSSQTAWCGVNWSMAAVCAVCCGGTPTRPHPTVSYAADRRRGGKAVTDDSLLHSGHRRRLSWPQRSIGDGLSFPSHRRDDADETGGRGRAGVPPQQTAHTAALKRLTPHLAVCEEVPRCGPARPNWRTNRAPNSPAGA
ncbi:hypothetical protein C0Q64_11405 [Streptomyces albidoflavus]|nr:hypothetical protein C0Q64_11405 [Streptomyces albidoflavus]